MDAFSDQGAGGKLTTSLMNKPLKLVPGLTQITFCL